MYKKIVAIVLVCCIVFVSPIHAFAESNEFLYRDSNFNKDKIVDIWSRGDHIEIYRTYIDDGSVLYKEYHNGDLVEQLIEKEEKDKFYNKIPEKTSRARLGTANLKIQHNSFNQIYEKKCTVNYSSTYSHQGVYKLDKAARWRNLIACATFLAPQLKISTNVAIQIVSGLIGVGILQFFSDILGVHIVVYLNATVYNETYTLCDNLNCKTAYGKKYIIADSTSQYFNQIYYEGNLKRNEWRTENFAKGILYEKYVGYGYLVGYSFY